MTTSNPEQATDPLQQAVNPKKRPMSDDGDSGKLAARREANRVHALKSRQRSKALLQELQRTVTQLSGEKAELERENAIMRAQIEVLQQQNLALTQSQRMLLLRAGQVGGAMQGAGGTGADGTTAAAAAALSALAPGFFGIPQQQAPAPAAPTRGGNVPASGAPGNAPAPALDQNAMIAAAMNSAVTGMPFSQMMGPAPVGPPPPAPTAYTQQVDGGGAVTGDDSPTTQSVVTADDVVA